MSAKEMFEELGYRKEDVEDIFTGEVFEYDYKYVKFDGTWLKEILFNDSTKLLHFNTELFNKTNNEMLTIDELKAIYKQCEELGWLKDSDIK